MSELIKRSEDWLDYHKGAPWETDAMKLIAELVKRVKELEQQLQQAHREGWEQGKRECVNIANNLFKYESGYYHYREDVGDAIAAMGYKERTNG